MKDIGYKGQRGSTREVKGWAEDGKGPSGARGGRYEDFGPKGAKSIIDTGKGVSGAKKGGWMDSGIN